MATEIERKFLVHGTPWLDTPCKAHHYTQAYLSLEKDRIIRVRCATPCNINGEIVNMHEKAQAWITIKGKNHNITCTEYEYNIPYNEAQLLLQYAAHTHVIEKIRYKLPHKQHTWDIDLFQGHNTGLVVAEIELASEKEIFMMPTWARQEVSHDHRYKNVNLCIHPFSAWNHT